MEPRIKLNYNTCTVCKAGLCSSSAWGPESTNFCLWVAKRSHFLLDANKGWAPQISWLGAFGDPVIFLRALPQQSVVSLLTKISEGNPAMD